MRIKEERRDLFSVGAEYYLAHCISADFALGKGIAKKFDEMFDLKRDLMDFFPNNEESFERKVHDYGSYGECILVERVFNLVTKARYFEKPTYTSLRKSLEGMKRLCKDFHVKKVAMPRIGCGIDRLEWGKVKQVIKTVFDDMDIDVLVCYL